MTLFEQAYLAGKQAAEARFAPVPAPAPRNPAPRSASTSATRTAAPPSRAGGVSALSGGSSASKSVMPGQMINANKGPELPASFGAPALLQQTAAQTAADTVAQRGTGMGAGGSTGTGVNLGMPPPNVTPPVIKVPALKLADFNMGMTPDPASKPDKIPKADNGRRVYGTSFSEPLRPLRDVDQAFNALSIPKNTDVLNEMGQAEFGSPSSPP